MGFRIEIGECGRSPRHLLPHPGRRDRGDRPSRVPWSGFRL